MASSTILDAIDRIPVAESAAEVEKLVTEALDALGIGYFAIQQRLRLHVDPGRVILAVRSPKGWKERYIERRYMLSDPVVRYIGLVNRGFRWREAVEFFADGQHARRMERMILDARRHGLEDGYFFPLYGRQGFVGAMTIGGAVVDLSAREMALVEVLARTAFWALIALIDPERGQPKAPTARLTLRELEALGCLSDGMTSPEIGEALGISNHTVDWYMNGIQEKLKAKNRHHSVAIAFRMGLIA